MLVGLTPTVDQISRDLRHHVRHRHRAWRTRGVDLDADEILRVEETRPAVARVLVAGQRRHPARDHRLDGGHIHLFRDFVDDLGGVDRDHAPGIGTGHAGGCRRFVFGDDVILRNRPRLQCRQCRSRGHRRQKFSAIHVSQLPACQLPASVPASRFQFPATSSDSCEARRAGSWQLAAVQNTYFTTNCTTRGSLTVLVIVPKVVLWMFACGGPKFG